MRSSLFWIFFILPCLILAGTVLFLTVNAPYLEDTQCILGYLVDPFPERLAHLADFNCDHRLVTTRLAAEVVRMLFGSVDIRVLCGVGALFLVFCMILIGSRFWNLEPRGRWLFLPCLWMATSFINYENTCWAVGGLSNYQVLFWALCAHVLLLRAQHIGGLIACLTCAVLASVSCAPGLAVWPALLLQLLFMYTARRFPYQYRRIVICLIVIGTATITLCLWGKPAASVPSVETPFGVRIIHTVLYFTAFLGCWVPIYKLALILGGITIAVGVWILLRVSRIQHFEIFGFLIYLVGIAGGGALLRSSNPAEAVSTRYTIFSILIIVTAFFLVCELTLSSWSRKTLLSVIGVMLVGSMCYSIGFLIIGAPHYARRNEIMRKNIMLAPENADGIRCWDFEKTRYSVILHKCRAQGIYDPIWNLRSGEHLPSAPLPWASYDEVR